VDQAPPWTAKLNLLSVLYCRYAVLGMNPNGADFSMVQLKYARRLSTREGKSIILPRADALWRSWRGRLTHATYGGTLQVITLRVLQSPSAAERIVAPTEFIRSFAPATEQLVVGLLTISSAGLRAQVARLWDCIGSASRNSQPDLLRRHEL
jgi:hypothetical protein